VIARAAAQDVWLKTGSASKPNQCLSGRIHTDATCLS
jgi:hypothetical protein